MSGVNCVTCSSINCFIKSCSPEWIKRIEEVKEQNFFKLKQNIFYEGYQIHGVYFIQRGKIKVYVTGLNGREQIVRFATDGHILGHKSSEQNERYSVGASALEDSLVCFIDNKNLNEIFNGKPKFSVDLMMYYSRELRKLEERLKNISQMNLREKMAETLLLMHDRFGTNSNYELNVLFSREDFASTAGSTRQQVVAQLTEFEAELLIEKRGKKIALMNVTALKNIVDKFSMQEV